MRIDIGEDFYIKADRLNWTIFEKRDPKEKDTDEEKSEEKSEEDANYRYAGFYPSLSSALTSLADKKMKKKIGKVNMANVEEIATIIREVRDEIINAVKDIPDEAIRGKTTNQTSGRRGRRKLESGDGIYHFPARALSVLPDLEVLDRFKQGRGETIKVKVEDVDALREDVEEAQSKCSEPSLRVVLDRVLSVIG